MATPEDRRDKIFKTSLWAASERGLNSYSSYQTVVSMIRIVEALSKLEIPDLHKKQVLDMLEGIQRDHSIDLKDLFEQDVFSMTLERDRDQASFTENFCRRIFGVSFSDLTPVQRQEAEYMLEHFWDFVDSRL